MKKIYMIGVTQNAGGVESYILNILRNADKKKFKFYFPKRGGMDLAYEDEIRSLGGIVIENCPIRHDIKRYFSFYKKMFQEYCFDAVYMNTCDIMSMDMLIFAKRAGVPIRIIHSHCSQNMIRQTIYHRLSEKWCRANLHRYATHYLACGEQAGKWMFKKQPFTIIQNGISTNRFRFNEKKRNEVRENLKIKAKYVIGFVGRLTPQKKPQFVIDIFSKFVQQHSDVELLIVGDGELRRETEIKIEKYGLQSKVKLLGARSDIPDLLCAMDCFCLPSGFEGFPFVLVEAQANGLPCVVSKNVSKECNLAGMMQFVGLDEPIENWVNALNNVTMTLPREQYADVIRNLGYDMKTEVQKVEKIMVGEVR